MRKLRVLVTLAFLSFVFSPLFSFAQRKTKTDEKPAYTFTVEKEIPSTCVKNQAATGTCWSYATTSFIESEIIAKGKGELDLSEMYFVRCTYPNKAQQYVRLHGKTVFGQGGQAHDVINVIREQGIVPETFYKGKNYSGDYHNHVELAAILEAMVEAVVEKKGGKLSDRWKDAVEAVLDVYFGDIPKEFIYNDEKYNPQSFSKKALEFNPDDYIEITSYSHHPFYSQFDLEVPDNWSHDLYYNVPIEDLITIMKNAISNGYTLCWDGDVSSAYFAHTQGVAIVPENEAPIVANVQTPDFTNAAQPEKNITQDLRQTYFDNQTTNDDHLMHIVGVAKDQNGKEYFITKNSWGNKSNDYDGKLNMSEAYVKLNTIAILINKKAIPANIAAKLKL